MESASDYARDSKKYGKHAIRKEQHRTRKIVIGIIIAVVVVIIVCVGVFAVTARAALNDAQMIVSQAEVLKSQLKTGDKNGSEQTAETISASAADMHTQTSNPVWYIASVVPVYGSDISTVQALAGVADDLCANALVPATKKLPSLDMSKLFSNGKIDVDSVQALCDAAGVADAAVQRSSDTVSGLSDTHFDQINGPLGKLKQWLPMGAKATALASEFKPVVSDMLGGNGKRTYLLVAQNNAELRSTGGFPGSWSTLVLDNGKISLGSSEAIGDAVPDLSEPVKLSKKEKKLFSKRVGYIPGDSGQIPDFSRAAKIWSQIWKKDGNVSIQGVIALDPVFLQDMLKLVGGVNVGGVTVDGSNAASILLNESYKTMPVEQTDAFFAAVAAKAFQKIMNGLGPVDKTELIKTVSNDIDSGRFLVWAKNSQEQAALKDAGCTGELSEDTTQPVLGVYTTEFCWSKISWYLSVKTDVGQGVKNSDGTTSYDVTVTYKNNLTKDELSGLVEYVYGNNPNKRSKGDMIDFIYLVAPAGGSISNVKATGYFGPYHTVNFSGYVDGKENDRTMAKSTYKGHEIWCGETQMKPQETTTVSFTVTVPADAQSELQVDSTPLGNQSY